MTAAAATVPLQVRRTKKGRVLVARWKRCLAGGAIRLRASFTADCEEIEGRVVKPKKRRVSFRARRYQPQQPDPTPDPDPDPTPDPDPDPDPGSADGTFVVIQERIFAARLTRLDLPGDASRRPASARAPTRTSYVPSSARGDRFE